MGLFENFQNYKKKAIKCIISATLLMLLFIPAKQINATELPPDYTDYTDDGPSTYTITLYESYNAQYELYEESMDNKFFFYCNVSNGSMTPGPVSFDIPANIVYALEKDGADIAYTAPNLIADQGNYVLRLQAEYNGDYYESTFRFSIKEAVNPTTTDETTTVDSQDAQIGEITPEDLVIDPNDDVTDEDIDRIINESGEAFAGEVDTSVLTGEDVNKYTGYRTEFVFETGMYNLTLQSGEVITSNVPNGAIVNSGVAITVPAGVETIVYKNGTLVDNPSLNFTEDGFYTVWFNASSVSFARYFPEENKYPFITFRIITRGTADMEIFNAPQGFKIVGITDKDEISIKNSEGGDSLLLDYYWMTNEGVYNFTVQDMSTGNQYKVRIDRDLTKPVFFLSGTDSKVTLQFGCEDVANVLLLRNNKQVNFDGKTIEGKGNYHIEVTDYAGNTTIADFELKDSFNVGTFFTVILLLIGGCAAFVFIRYHRTCMRIR